MMHTEKPEYDDIASKYTTDAERRGDRVCVFAPSAQHYLGDVSNKSLLELACGSGYFTRLIKGWGAQRLVGVDLSNEMISLALAEESKAPLGIEYRVGDVATLGRIGDFNSVFAAFLLHYAPSPEDLLRMCRTISANLLPGGSFVTFVENPNCPVYDGIKYDVSVVAQGPVVDGARITRTHYENGGPVFSFDHCHYEQGTYERVLGEAGLEQVRWLPFVKASDADLGYPNGYWDDFVSGGSITVLTCRKGN